MIEDHVEALKLRKWLDAAIARFNIHVTDSAHRAARLLKLLSVATGTRRVPHRPYRLNRVSFAAVAQQARQARMRALTMRKLRVICPRDRPGRRGRLLISPRLFFLTGGRR
jgi:hypothetical protein